VDDYAKLAVAVGKALRDAVPHEIYIGPACSTMDFKFLEACFKAGCLEYWQAVSVHPYRQGNPESVMADYARLANLIKQYAPAGKDIPIISGEWGYSSAWRRYDPTRQGQQLPRELLTNIASGARISIWYDWHDDGTDPKESEHHFGTVENAYHAGADPVYTPKPAYLAMQKLTLELKDCRFKARISTANPKDFVMRFSRSTGDVFAVWTSDKDHEVTLPTGTVTLTAAPQYIHASR